MWQKSNDVVAVAGMALAVACTPAFDPDAGPDCSAAADVDLKPLIDFEGGKHHLDGVAIPANPESDPAQGVIQADTVRVSSEESAKGSPGGLCSPGEYYVQLSAANISLDLAYWVSVGDHEHEPPDGTGWDGIALWLKTAPASARSVGVKVRTWQTIDRRYLSRPPACIPRTPDTRTNAWREAFQYEGCGNDFMAVIAEIPDSWTLFTLPWSAFRQQDPNHGKVYPKLDPREIYQIGVVAGRNPARSLRVAVDEIMLYRRLPEGAARNGIHDRIDPRDPWSSSSAGGAANGTVPPVGGAGGSVTSAGGAGGAGG